MANGGAATPFLLQGGNVQTTPLTAMQQAAQAGQLQTPQAGAPPMTVQQPASFAGTPTLPQATGTQLQPYNFSSTAPQPTSNAYTAFLNALNQIAATNPIQAIQGINNTAKPGGAPRAPSGNINGS